MARMWNRLSVGGVLVLFMIPLVSMAWPSLASAQMKRFTNDQIQQQKVRRASARAELRQAKQLRQETRAQLKASKAELRQDRRAVRAARPQTRAANRETRQLIFKGASREEVNAALERRDAAQANLGSARAERQNDRTERKAVTQDLRADGKVVRHERRDVKHEQRRLNHQRQHRGFTIDEIREQGAKVQDAKAGRAHHRQNRLEDQAVLPEVNAELQASNQDVNVARQAVRHANKEVRQLIKSGASGEAVSAALDQRDATKADLQNVRVHRNDVRTIKQAVNQDIRINTKASQRDTRLIQRQKERLRHRVDNYVNGGRRGLVRDVTSERSNTLGDGQSSNTISTRSTRSGSSGSP